MASEITIFINDGKLYDLPILPTTASKRYHQETVKRPLGSDFHQILFILDGEGSVIACGKEYDLKKGCAFYTSPETPVEYVNKGGLVSAFLTVVGDGVSKLGEAFGISGFVFNEGMNTELYSGEIRKMVTAYSEGRAAGALSAMAYSIFSDFFEDTDKRSDSIEEVRLFIERGFARAVSLSDLSAMASISVSGLCHRFKERYGMGVIAYLLDVRLRYARELLTMNSYVTVKEIAFSSGFNDVSYFCRAFKNKYGITPEEYRRL